MLHHKISLTGIFSCNFVSSGSCDEPGLISPYFTYNYSLFNVFVELYF